ncbi:MAG: hypothetical protein K2W82_15605 [Candidatus Obscuribacterales bacterium]|nr:hypothetical protein [Candidatus Obscuribacterales bacterium]
MFAFWTNLDRRLDGRATPGVLIIVAFALVFALLGKLVVGFPWYAGALSGAWLGFFIGLAPALYNYFVLVFPQERDYQLQIDELKLRLADCRALVARLCPGNREVEGCLEKTQQQLVAMPVRTKGASPGNLGNWCVATDEAINNGYASLCEALECVKNPAVSGQSKPRTNALRLRFYELYQDLTKSGA